MSKATTAEALTADLRQRSRGHGEERSMEQSEPISGSLQAWPSIRRPEHAVDEAGPHMPDMQARVAAAGQTKPSLVRKLAEVMAVVERLPKRGHNLHFNYDFATESDITAAIRGQMAARQLILVPDVQTISWREVATKNGVNAIACVLVKFSVCDGESGEVLSFMGAGEGQDSGDKCLPKAITSALKYACLKLFLIPTGDDPERDEKKTKTDSRGQAAPATRDVRTSGPRPQGLSRTTPPGQVRPTVDLGPSMVGQVDANAGIIAEVSAGMHGANFQVTLSSGVAFLCYNPKLRMVAEQAQRLGQRVQVATKRSSGGNVYLTGIIVTDDTSPAPEPAMPHELEGSPPERDDDIAF